MKVWPLFVAQLCSLVTQADSQIAPESLSIIPDDYKKTLLPKVKDDEPVTIGLSYKITGVYEVNLKDMSLLFGMYFRVSWEDNRLLWPNNTEADVIVLDTGILRRLWVPDIFFEYSRESKQFKLLQNVQGMWFYKEGKIYLSTMLQVKLACAWNFQNYPFDVQRCSFVIASYGYTSGDMAFAWLPLGVAAASKIKDELPSYDFTLLPKNATTCPCKGCLFDDFPCGLAVMLFARKFTAHLLTVYIPSALFVGVAWLSFSWPSEVIPGRTVLVITSLLTVMSMYGSIRSTTPETSYVKALDVWMFVCIFLTVLTLFEYALILRLRRLQEIARSHQVRPLKGATQLSQAYHYEKLELKVDFWAKIILPVGFAIFNIIYWSFYLQRGSYSDHSTIRF